jgi:hypothetical protein
MSLYPLPEEKWFYGHVDKRKQGVKITLTHFFTLAVMSSVRVHNADQISLGEIAGILFKSLKQSVRNPELFERELPGK